VRGTRLLLAAPLVWLMLACSGNQHALDTRGPVAAKVATLFWVMAGVGSLIFVIVMALLWWGLIRKAPDGGARPLRYVHSRNLVLLSGVVIPLVILFFFTLGSASVERDVGKPLPAGTLTIEVIGHQWWWEIHYLDWRGKRHATTANEMVLPVGRPVRLLLQSADVIHSFWVPQLAGKTDLIPGKTNVSWVQADKPGVFRGQCAEFCGLQHAHMGLMAEAVSPEMFEAWLARQRAPAALLTDPALIRGQQVFLAAQCMMCHTIRGTSAVAQLGPDLTHIGSRRMIAAATLPNTRGHLAAWILKAQDIKPGNFMPNNHTLDGESLNALLDYLQSLQ